MGRNRLNWLDLGPSILAPRFDAAGKLLFSLHKISKFHHN